jgi:hypothetical protein
MQATDPANRRPFEMHVLTASFLAVLSATTLVAQNNLAPAPAPIAKNATSPNQAQIVRQMRVATGQLNGRLLSNVSRQPVANSTFQLLDNTGKKVADIVTSAEGTYITPTLQKGSYTLALNENLKLHLAVDETAMVTQLDIVVPEPTVGNWQNPGDLKQPALPQNPNALPPAPGGSAPLSSAPAAMGGGLGAGSWALITAGAATVAVPVVAARRSGKEKPISSSGLGIRR